MNLSDLLEPTNCTTQQNHIPAEIVRNYKDYDFSDYDVFIVGYQEDRNSENQGAGKAADCVREQLYSLFATEKPLKICDLGNCRLGKTVKDSYIIVQELCKQLEKYNKPLIIIGGTQEITLTLAQERLNEDEFPTITCIDAQIDMQLESEDFYNTNYIAQLAETYDNVKINYIALQEYLSHKTAYDFLRTNNFPHIRLGNVFHNAKHTEPMLREAQLISFDTTALRYSEFDANRDQLPAGLYVEDACQMAWYAGFSYEMNTFLLSEFNPVHINSVKPSATVCALLLWYVLDGISQRNTIQYDNEEFYTIYYVKNDLFEHDVRFFEHTITKQMWVELFLPLYNEKRMVPCNYSDYQSFSNENIPDSWLMELQRKSKN
ncbi:MAG: arginase family protein [Bacteroidetes bacterium]|nr:arginase family protein [Bacteroidota bacterium]